MGCGASCHCSHRPGEQYLPSGGPAIAVRLRLGERRACRGLPFCDGVSLDVLAKLPLSINWEIAAQADASRMFHGVPSSGLSLGAGGQSDCPCPQPLAVCWRAPPPPTPACPRVSVPHPYPLGGRQFLEKTQIFNFSPRLVRPRLETPELHKLETNVSPPGPSNCQVKCRQEAPPLRVHHRLAPTWP